MIAALLLFFYYLGAESTGKILSRQQGFLWPGNTIFDTELMLEELQLLSVRFRRAHSHDAQ
jgi:hypothetical protein